MRVTGIVASLRVASLNVAKGFHQGYLGLSDASEDPDAQPIHSSSATINQ